LGNEADLQKTPIEYSDSVNDRRNYVSPPKGPGIRIDEEGEKHGLTGTLKKDLNQRGHVRTVKPDSGATASRSPGMRER